MGKSRKIHVATLEFEPGDITKNRGHEYGAGRKTQVHRHKNSKRERDKLRQELRRYY